ncbi:hypothetical protein [Rhizobium sp. BK251]|uniref:hypothetical protein n=1 Tax=Rhizobium sp. BK251 TaxID=2512125 RepID=UPI0010505CC6|nr:hypothetical protein [Rhizobium sp. BK251]TCL71353.1 hypothetical protein EV286_106329 [Rhizobium sp. BK251]
MLSFDRTNAKTSAGATVGGAAGIADWLCLAAAPTFAIMGLLSANGGADMICSSMPDAFPLDGMAAMYLLMSAFHLPPWLRLFSHRSPYRRR